MKIANHITKSLMQHQIDAMEKCKYDNEGTERTAGSYMLTYSKSMLTLSDQDEEVFDEYSKSTVEPLVLTAAGALVLGVACVKIHDKLKTHHEAKKAIKEKESC